MIVVRKYERIWMITADAKLASDYRVENKHGFEYDTATD